MKHIKNTGYYLYHPSISIAILFTALFLSLLLIKLLFFVKFCFKTSKTSINLDDLRSTDIPPSTDAISLSEEGEKNVKKKGKLFCLSPSIPIIAGILLESLGYITRIISVSNHGLIIFVFSQVFVLVAPSFIAGGIYMTFGRITELFGAQEYNVIRSKHLVTFLVMIDVFSTLTIGAAGSLMAERKTANLGYKLCLAALAVQLVLFSFFVYMAVRFLTSLKRYPNKAVTFIETYYDISWKKLTWILIAAMSWIILRCILRLIEFAQKYDGILARHELAYYTIDALPIFIAAGLVSSHEIEKTLWKLNCVYEEPVVIKD